MTPYMSESEKHTLWYISLFVSLSGQLLTRTIPNHYRPVLVLMSGKCIYTCVLQVCSGPDGELS